MGFVLLCNQKHQERNQFLRCVEGIPLPRDPLPELAPAQHMGGTAEKAPSPPPAGLHPWTRAQRALHGPVHTVRVLDTLTAGSQGLFAWRELCSGFHNSCFSISLFPFKGQGRPHEVGLEKGCV